MPHSLVTGALPGRRAALLADLNRQPAFGDIQQLVAVVVRGGRAPESLALDHLGDDDARPDGEVGFSLAGPARLEVFRRVFDRGPPAMHRDLACISQESGRSVSVEGTCGWYPRGMPGLEPAERGTRIDAVSNQYGVAAGLESGSGLAGDGR